MGPATWIVGLVVVGAAGAIAWSFLGKASGALGGRAVREGRAERSSPEAGAELTTASGYVVARTRAAVSPKHPGKLVKLLVDVGDRVEKGQLLAELDHAEQDAALARAAAEIERARRDLETARAAHRESSIREADARREAERAERLLKELVITESERDRAKAEAEARQAQAAMTAAAVESAVAGVASAESAHREAEARREDAFIRADFAGRVLRKEAEVGEVIAPATVGGGSTRGALLTLADFDTLELEVDVIERDVARVSEGAPCRIVLDAYPREPFPGRVRQVVPTADRQKATVQVKVSFDRPDPRVLPEMGGKAVFLREGTKVSGAADRVLVPTSALSSREGVPGVWVLQREGNDVRTRFFPIEAGPAEGDRTTILKGLSGGERVVLDPPDGLKDGERVTAADR
jgi:RND family efflux transporter MFP subunit